MRYRRDLSAGVTVGPLWVRSTISAHDHHRNVTNIDRRLADVLAEVAHLEGARLALVNGRSRGLSRRRAETVASKPAEPKYEVVPAGKLNRAFGRG